jgi:hypothetical protein
LSTDPVKVGNSELYINVPLRIVMMRELNIKGSFRVSLAASRRVAFVLYPSG